MKPEEILVLIWNILGIIGALSTLLIIVGGLFIFFCWCIGIFPLLKRLGLGRWFRKVFIAADIDNYQTIKNDLVESGVFREKNISQINDKSLSKVKDVDLIILHYQSFTASQIKQVIADKKNDAGLVIYFPEFNPPINMVPKDMLENINNHTYVILVNMRGRLINDVLITLMSTSYDKKRR